MNYRFRTTLIFASTMPPARREGDHDQPEVFQALDHRAKLVEIDGLGDVAAGHKNS
jgi:hypothetical protein